VEPVGHGASLGERRSDEPRHELVGPQPRQGGALGHAAPQHLGGLDQRPVADPVAPGLVDPVEPVEVDQQQRRLGDPGGLELLQAMLELVAVEQPSQRVVGVQIGELGAQPRELVVGIGPAVARAARAGRRWRKGQRFCGHARPPASEHTSS
jgi:hypothetical protein